MIQKLVLLFFAELVIYNQVGNALSDQDIEIVKAEVQHYLVARDGQLIARQNDLEERVRILEDKVEKLEELSRLGTLRSCAEYAQYGIRTNGLYFVDPDGPLQDQPPFQVFCNFDAGEIEGQGASIFNEKMHHSFTCRQYGGDAQLRKPDSSRTLQ